MNNIVKYGKNTFIWIWRCFLMIIKSDKKIVCVKDIPSNIIDEAIFILKENVIDNSTQENEERCNEILLNEAEEIVEEYMNKIKGEGNEEEIVYVETTNWIKEVLYITGLLIILAICIYSVI